MSRFLPAVIIATLAGMSVASRPAGAQTTAPADADSTFVRDLRALTRHPHRLAGYGEIETDENGETVIADQPGSLAAGAYVERRLREMGVDEVYTQRFPVVQPVYDECRLFVDDELVVAEDGQAIYPMRPNLLHAPVTPEEGLTGETVYAGSGEATEFGQVLPQGRIVVLDFDCDQNWLNAFALGAKAVIFVGAEKPARHTYQHMNMPANLPRFYVPTEVAKSLGLLSGSRNVRIEAACHWNRLTARNVIGVIRGTDPKFNPDRANEAMVLAARLDTLSEVPLIGAGARDAANAAVLLQIGQYALANRPKRTIILAFFDGESLNHAGSREFYGSLYRRFKGAEIAEFSLEKRLEMLTEERSFIEAAAKVFAREDVFSDEAEQLRYHKEAVQALTDQAEFLSSNALDELRPMRLLAMDLNADVEQAEGELQAIPADQRSSERAQELRRSIERMRQRLEPLGPRIAELEKVDRRWNRVVKYLYEKETVAELRADANEERGAQERFLRATEELPAQLAQARAELERIDGRLADGGGDLDVPREQLAEQREKVRQLETELTEARQESTLYELMRLEKDLEHLKTMTLALHDRRLAAMKLDRSRLDESIRLRDAIGPESNYVVLHVGMNIGDDRKLWSFVHGDDTLPLDKDKVGNYDTIFKPMRDLDDRLGEAVANFDPRPISRMYDIRMFVPGRFADNGGAVARLFALFNLSTITVLDPMSRQGQPADTVEALNVANMASQADEICPFLTSLASDERLSQTPSFAPSAKYLESEWTGSKRAGPSVRRTGAGGAMEQMPVRNATVSLMRRAGAGPFAAADVKVIPPGFRFPFVLKTDVSGIYQVGPSHEQHYNANFTLAVAFDKELGNVTGGPAPESRGIVAAVSDQTTSVAGYKDNANVKIFGARYMTVVGYGYDRGGTGTIAMHALSTARFQPDRYLLAEHENVLTLYAAEEIRGMKLFNSRGAVLLDNENTPSAYQGVGLQLGELFEHPFTPLQTAHDLRVLNEYRMDLLRENRISQESLAILNGRAKDIEEDAVDTIAEGRTTETVDKVVGDLSASATYSRRVYGPLVGVMNDLVSAVVLLLLLAIPFGYALERLIIGTPHIYRQIGWFAVFFLLTFGVLYMVNPAFQIAATPIIIFLAFTIILLSCLVIFIMVRKLQTEVQKMQGLASTVHSADVSRLSTMMAAVNMGISTMRRRPLRTLLTAVTVVLLTFTILTFASFGSSWGTRQTYQGPMHGSSTRILVRHQLWSPIPQATYNVLRGHFAEEAVIVPRYWLSPTAQEAKTAVAENRNLDMLLADADVKVVSPTAAAVGVSTEDLRRQEELREVLAGDLDLLTGDGIFLTRAVRDAMELTDADIGESKVLLRGRSFTFAGVIEDAVERFVMLEGSSMMPVDYQATGGSMMEGQQQASDTLTEIPGMESAQFARYNVDKVVFIAADRARALGGRIRSITLYPHSSDDTEDLAVQTATVSSLPTYYSSQGGAYRLIFTSLATASGVRDLLIPVLLGGLIVFATMLGSVSDREREIYTFSSLGLAPPHIASLFFAEASMYAVIGGMGGYLLGQVVARVLAWLSTIWNFSIPSMNYSSTNAIVTVLIVMGTVLVSTIYPAIKASKSANPGIQRSWKIPKPEGDLYDLIFPFTVSTYDIIGVVSFLKEHFDNFTDTSLGAFASTESHIFRQADNDMLGFRGTVALAPFDLGVNQRFAMLSQPSDIEGIDEVRVLLYRLSGAQGDWQRSNRVFVNDLRKQLLIWRSLPDDVMERYRQKTLAGWDELPREQVSPESIAAEDNDAERSGGVA